MSPQNRRACAIPLNNGIIPSSIQGARPLMTIKQYTKLVLANKYDAFLRRVLSIRSRGNTRIQRGCIMSRDRYNQQKRGVLAYDFR